MTPAYEATFMATAIGMVRGGLGITLLPSSALELSAAHDLATRVIDDPQLTRKLGILCDRRRSFSPAVQAFVDLLIDRVAVWFKAQAGKSAHPIVRTTRGQQSTKAASRRSRAKR